MRIIELTEEYNNKKFMVNTTFIKIIKISGKGATILLEHLGYITVIESYNEVREMILNKEY